MNYWLLLIPVLSALVGLIGSRVAWRILLQKIIPRSQQDLAKKIAKAISNEFSFTDIEQKISDPENVKKIMPLVEKHIDDFLRNKLKAKMPVIGMFIGDKTITSLKEVFLQEIEDLFPQVLKQFSGNLQNELDIETKIAQKIATIPPGRLEEMFSPALRYFQFTGAIAGFIIGLINVIIFFLLE
jgi:uncharacterized membrane protein YheB (UPF0754 family)